MQFHPSSHLAPPPSERVVADVQAILDDTYERLYGAPRDVVAEVLGARLAGLGVFIDRRVADEWAPQIAADVRPSVHPD